MSIELDLTPEQEEFLNEYDVSTGSLKKISGKQLHEFMIHTDGYTDGYELVFFDDYNGGSMKDQNKFLYYMGAEREAELKAKHLGITIWTNIDEGRLGRYNEENTEDE